MDIAVGKYQRRRQIIRDPFVLQLPEHRKIDGAIGVCKSPPDRHPASVNLSDGTTPEFRSLNQVKWSLSYVDAGSRTPNEPTAHNLWVQRAHEYCYPPERNATLDQPVTQLCDHLNGPALSIARQRRANPQSTLCHYEPSHSALVANCDAMPYPKSFFGIFQYGCVARGRSRPSCEFCH